MGGETEEVVITAEIDNLVIFHKGGNVFTYDICDAQVYDRFSKKFFMDLKEVRYRAETKRMAMTIHGNRKRAWTVHEYDTYLKTGTIPLR